MPRFLVQLTRTASEDAAAIVEAPDARAAKDAALALNLDWYPGVQDPRKVEVHAYIEQVDDDEPLGVQHDEEETLRRTAPELLAALIEAEEEIRRLRHYTTGAIAAHAYNTATRALAAIVKATGE